MPVQAELPCTVYNPSDLLARIRSNIFPNLVGDIAVLFTRQKSLACVTYPSTTKLYPATITINSILNTAGTPIEVITHILIHELLHLEISPRQVGDRELSHPPEFWEREQELSPSADSAFYWIYLHFSEYLKIQKRKERILVKRSAYSSLSDPKRLSFAEAVEFAKGAKVKVERVC